MSLTPTYPQNLAPASRHLLQRLATRPFAADMYLAGSAALALYVGHRQVRDVDLMSATHRLASANRRDLLGELLALEPGLQVETARDGFLSTRAPGDDSSGIALKFYYYPYPLAAPCEEFVGLAVISALDLGLMKLGAIISRGTPRDFLDLHALCRHLPLREILDRAEDKFGHVRDFPLQALKGLADLPVPGSSAGAEWEETREWVEGPVRELARKLVGLPE